MAEAAKVTKQVERVVVDEVEVITLEINQEEANALRELLGKCNAWGPTQGIYSALLDLTERRTYRVTFSDSWGSYQKVSNLKVEKV